MGSRRAAAERCRLAARQAKAYCSRAARQVVEISVQLHGGIAITWEHLAHVRVRRALFLAASFGDERAHLRAIADARLGEAPAEVGADGLSRQRRRGAVPFRAEVVARRARTDRAAAARRRRAHGIQPSVASGAGPGRLAGPVVSGRIRRARPFADLRRHPQRRARLGGPAVGSGDQPHHQRHPAVRQRRTKARPSPGVALVHGVVVSRLQRTQRRL